VVVSASGRGHRGVSKAATASAQAKDLQQLTALASTADTAPPDLAAAYELQSVFR